MCPALSRVTLDTFPNIGSGCGTLPGSPLSECVVYVRLAQKENMKKKSESNHHDESVQELVERLVYHLCMWDPSLACIMADTIMKRNWVFDTCQLSCTQQRKLSSIDQQAKPSSSTDTIPTVLLLWAMAGRGAGLTDPQIVEENLELKTRNYEDR